MGRLEMSDKIAELLEVMREILKWTKFAGAGEVRNTLTAALDTQQKRLIYNLSNGKRGSVEIAKTVKVGDSTVRRYWETWARQGIVEPIKVQGGTRFKKSFEPEDFGIAIQQSKTEEWDSSNAKGANRE